MDRLAELDSREANERFVFYASWVYDCRTAKESCQRLVVVLWQLFGPDDFLDAFGQAWPEFERTLREQHEAQAQTAAPLIFGREKYLRRAAAERGAWLDGLREYALDLWRSGGRGAEEALGEYVDLEGAMIGLVEAVAMEPDLDDEGIAALARRVTARRMAGHFAAAEIRAYCEGLLVPSAVPEARRRFRRSGMFDTLAEQEAEWRRQGLSKTEARDRRKQLIEFMRTEQVRDRRERGG